MLGVLRHCIYGAVRCVLIGFLLQLLGLLGEDRYGNLNFHLQSCKLLGLLLELLLGRLGRIMGVAICNWIVDGAVGYLHWACKWVMEDWEEFFPDEFQ